MQNEIYAQRIRDLGAPQERVRVVGSLKFDTQPLKSVPEWTGILSGPVIVAGSTHRTEEDLILDAFVALRRDFPDLNVILAPRHPERFREVEELTRKRGLAYLKRSELDRTAVAGKERLLPAGLSLALLLLPATGSSQAWGFLGAGATIPTGDYGDYANTGWIGSGGVGFPIGDAGLAVGAEGFYGQNNHDVDGDKTNPYGVLGFVQYSFGDPAKFHPYVLGGAGLLVHKYSSDNFNGDSESQFAYSFGGGVAYPLGPTTGLYAEGRYWGSDDATFFGIMGGFYVSFGGK